MIVRSEANCFIDGRALVYGEVAEVDGDNPEVQGALASGLVVELGAEGQPVPRTLTAPAPRRGCCGG